jgi:MFS family permease
VTRTLLWAETGGVAAIQAAISLMWLVYRVYIVSLCKQFGLEPDFVSYIFIFEDLLAIVIEPISGRFSDRLKSQMGTTLPLITGGVIAAATLFIAIPTITLLFPLVDLSRSLLVTVMLLWAIAMAVFRAPVLSLLGKYASELKLPQATSLLTVVMGLVGAIKPWASRLILTWGAPFAFSLASVSLLAVAGFLRFVDQRSLPQELEPLPKSPLNFWQLFYLLLIGMGMGSGFRLLVSEILPKLLTADFKELGMAAFFFALAMAGLAIAKITEGWSNQLLLIWATVVVAICSFSFAVWQNIIFVGIICIPLVLALSILFNGTIPLAIALFPSRTGLAIGIYSSGLTTVNGILNFLPSNSLSRLGLPFLTIVAAIIFLTIGFFVWLSIFRLVINQDR